MYILVLIRLIYALIGIQHDLKIDWISDTNNLFTEENRKYYNLKFISESKSNSKITN